MNTTYSISVEIAPRAPREAAPGGRFCEEFSHSADLRAEYLCRGSLVVIGDAFHLDRLRPGLASEDTAARPLDALSTIARACWGRFVAVAKDPETGEVAVYRDPSGMVPCYFGRSRSQVAIATDAVSICRHLVMQPSIDWGGIANHLLAPDRRRRETCLAGIREILPGELVHITPDDARHDLLWKPGHHVGTRLNIPFVEAAELLEGHFSEAVAVWCERYPRPLIALSGGFDSSAITALAARCGPVGLIQYFGKSPQADERSYARAVARHLGLELDAVFCDPGQVQVDWNLSAARPRPSARAFTQSFDRHAADKAAVLGATAHFNGGGGDNVFGKLHSAYPLADRYLHSGLSRDLSGTAADICHATGASLPAVLRQAMAAVRTPDRGKSWPDTADLLSARAIAMRDDEPHPWIATQTPLWPGQRQLIRNIARATAATDHLHIEGALPTIFPILSQPLVELCLSLPTWVWLTGGQDRALARAAMKPYLPADILGRRLKGAFDGLVYEIVDLHRARILADLRDGALAGEALIDVDAVEHVLKAHGGKEAGIIRVLHLHEVEMWCRHWS
ncbi:MAG: asparagine synthase-related protein [Novosphingobium sp.]